MLSSRTECVYIQLRVHGGILGLTITSRRVHTADGVSRSLWRIQSKIQRRVCRSQCKYSFKQTTNVQSDRINRRNWDGSIALCDLHRRSACYFCGSWYSTETYKMVAFDVDYSRYKNKTYRLWFYSERSSTAAFERDTLTCKNNNNNDLLAVR